MGLAGRTVVVAVSGGIAAYKACELVRLLVQNGAAVQVIMTAPQFAWLHPISELIVRIDQTLDEEAPDTPVDVDTILTQARRLVAPDQTEKPYAERYLMALQEVPDVVVAHGKVTAILKENPAKETLH